MAATIGAFFLTFATGVNVGMWYAAAQYNDGKPFPHKGAALLTTILVYAAVMCAINAFIKEAK